MIQTKQGCCIAAEALCWSSMLHCSCTAGTLHLMYVPYLMLAQSSANLNYKTGRDKKSGMLFAAFFATAAKHGFKEGSTIL